MILVGADNAVAGRRACSMLMGGQSTATRSPLAVTGADGEQKWRLRPVGAPIRFRTVQL